MLPYPIHWLPETMKLRSGNEIPFTASFPAESFPFFASLYIQSSMLIALPRAP